MTQREHTFMMRGVAAGTVMGLAIGLMAALVIAIRPETVGALIH